MARSHGEGSVRKYKDGWRASYHVTRDGKTVRGSRTFRPPATKRDAHAWLRSQLDRPAAVGTLAEWLDVWEPLHRAGTAASTWRKDFHTIKTHVRPRLGTVRLRDLTALRLRTYFAELSGVSPGERHKAGKVLRLILNAAVANGLLSANPIDGRQLKIPPKPTPEKVSLTPAELAAVLAAADDLGHGAMFRVWVDAALRPGELLGLRWDDYTPPMLTVRRSVCVMTGEPKELKTAGSRRSLPLSPPTVAALEAVERTDAVMFPAPRGGHWWARNFAEHVVSPVLKRAGVRATPYTFRHTCATLLLRAGVPIKVVSERLGHRDAATTLKHYAHVVGGDQDRASGVMGGLLGGA